MKYVIIHFAYVALGVILTTENDFAHDISVRLVDLIIADDIYMLYLARNVETILLLFQ